MDSKQLGEQPIHPVTPDQEREVLHNGDGWGSLGLTKREEFAKAIMQGFAANPAMVESSRHDLADHAVQFADALLYSLARQK